MKTFDGKVAFITGAAHCQGRATALALAKEGAAIAAFDLVNYGYISFLESGDYRYRNLYHIRKKRNNMENSWCENDCIFSIFTLCLVFNFSNGS